MVIYIFSFCFFYTSYFYQYIIYFTGNRYTEQNDSTFFSKDFVYDQRSLVIMPKRYSNPGMNATHKLTYSISVQITLARVTPISNINVVPATIASVLVDCVPEMNNGSIVKRTLYAQSFSGVNCTPRVTPVRKWILE